MVEWNQLDVSSFLDQVTGFLTEHGQLDGLSSQPPAKRARSVRAQSLFTFLDSVLCVCERDVIAGVQCVFCFFRIIIIIITQ